MIRAVVFDLGGVVLDSPFDVIAQTEHEHGLTAGFFNRIAAREDGAWARHETGRVGRSEFVEQFGAECRAEGADIDVARLLDTIESYAVPRPRMMEAIKRLRVAGNKVAALTNNWESPAADWEVPLFQSQFDVFVESWIEGVRKPDPLIYTRLLERLDLNADQCVFLDDIGRNLKTARELGMTTIKVVDPEVALEELGSLIGFDL
jgi:putative hydrolase of the HAD superfamily